MESLFTKRCINQLEKNSPQKSRLRTTINKIKSKNAQTKKNQRRSYPKIQNRKAIIRHPEQVAEVN